MVNRNKSFNKQRQCYQTLVVTALLSGSFFQFIAPALADGTAAGTSISNTATATYEDPNATGSPINATSNTVTVTVAEVAGITVTGSGITGTANVGQTLIYTYTVTNVGNDLTKFQIPNLATTTGPATVSGTLPGSTPGNLQYSTDGGATWINIPAGGLTTVPVPVNGTVLVRVPVTVQAGAQTGDIITARLGQTPGDAQNQPRIADGGDVYTVDNGNTAGASINGVREASATQQTKVGNTATSKALATILKTKTAYDNAGTSTNLSDDLLTYGLSLRVESNDVTANGVTPAALAGTTITVNFQPSSPHILVSDAIPANTVLNSTPIAPSGWKVVYTTDNRTSINAEAAAWSTIAPPLDTVTRVGFINDTTVVTSVATGTTVSGFSIQVKSTAPTTATTSTINNIAQVAGTTAGDPTNKVYDNSGDQNPDNYDSTAKTFAAAPDAGITSANTDTNNNNTATNSTTGALNVTTLTVPNATSVLNGPSGVPDAVGPTDNNDDFTNKSALIPPNTAPGIGVDPAAVPFTNTVQNTGTSPANISLVPTPPKTPAAATDLPNGTVVTISYQSLSAAYTYNNVTGFTYLTSTGIVGGSPISATNPLRIDGVPANGGKATYGVSVDLPAGTPLSTDTTAQGTGITNIQRGFPTPVTAYIESAATPTGIPGTNPLNISIDRVYTGFLQLLKESRVLQGTGPALPVIADGTFSVTPKKPAPGNIIEYRITYKNISTPQVGTGNLILNADKIVITEDGTQTPNNWAKDNDNNSQIDTSNIVSSAKDSGTSTIQFFPGSDQTGTTANTDVTKYVDAVTGQVAPGIQRTFTFQRKVN